MRQTSAYFFFHGCHGFVHEPHTLAIAVGFLSFEFFCPCALCFFLGWRPQCPGQGVLSQDIFFQPELQPSSSLAHKSQFLQIPSQARIYHLVLSPSRARISHLLLCPSQVCFFFFICQRSKPAQLKKLSLSLSMLPLLCNRYILQKLIIWFKV